MDWYEAEVAQLVNRLAAVPIAAPAVFYGSSSITLWDSLAADLACERAVNAGFGGSTLAACSHFFERIVPPLRPSALVVYAGDNDLGDGQSPDDVVASFYGIAEQVDRRCGAIPFGFISIKPSPARAAILRDIQTVNARIRELIERRPDGYYVDVFTPMLRGGAPRPELFSDDGLHLNRAGYDLWTRILTQFHHRFCAPVTAAD